MNREVLLHHLRFDQWATGRVLVAAGALTAEELSRDLKSSYSSVLGTLVHIYQADCIWWDRLQGAPTGPLSKYEPEPAFDAFSAQWLAVLDRYLAWAEPLSDSDWQRPVEYHTLDGNPGRQSAAQIILHRVNHASYHRGQVATLYRQLGYPPVSTDLIHYYRTLSLVL